MKPTDLIVGFNPQEEKRIRTHLNKLLPYFKKDEFAIVGGIPIRYFAAIKGVKVPKRSFNDIDMVASNVTTINPKVAKEFLVSHYHYNPNLPKNESNFYVVLVDPESKTKVDIFDEKNQQYVAAKRVKVKFAGIPVYVESLEDQLVVSVKEAYRVVTKNFTEEPKKIEDIELMLRIADLELAQSYWKKADFENHPKTLIEAFNATKKKLKENPELLVERKYRKRKPYQCEGCEESKNANFPVTKMEKVYKTLGYIE
jgi:hypothetical protein